MNILSVGLGAYVLRFSPACCWHEMEAPQVSNGDVEGACTGTSGTDRPAPPISWAPPNCKCVGGTSTHRCMARASPRFLACDSVILQSCKLDDSGDVKAQSCASLQQLLRAQPSPRPHQIIAPRQPAANTASTDDTFEGKRPSVPQRPFACACHGGSWKEME